MHVTPDSLVQLRKPNGRKPVILCNNAPGLFPVIGYIISEDGTEAEEYKWTRNGQFHPDYECDEDLVPLEIKPLEQVSAEKPKRSKFKKWLRDNSYFRYELEKLISDESIENGSNTPNFILAQYLSMCLFAFDEATKRRDHWHNPS